MQIRDIFTAVDSHQDEFAHTWAGMEQCKSLARVIKARRAPAWPTPPSTDLPSRELADALVAQYMLTTESIYRILHVPTFQRDYVALFEGKGDTSFLVQVKLVFALGAITYDESFSLRTRAVRWLYEARTWMAEPKFKSRLDMSSLQTSLLLVLAQERIGAGGETMWIAMGSIVRRAMYMGMHRDPAHLPPRGVFAAEMRRRLWNTVLELALQSSLMSGGAPLLTTNDFDTASPGNYKDTQLDMEEDGYTQTSVAVALRKTFPQRLAVVKLLNDLSAAQDYEETLTLDARLRAAFKDLTRTVHKYGLSDFETQAVDLLMQRYLLALHVPYASQEESKHAYSRKIVVETALKGWRTLGPSAPCETLRRLSVGSSGFYPVAAMHAALLIAMELRLQLREDEGLGPTPLRPDLVAVVDESPSWCLKALQAGETNVKGYMLLSGLAAHVDAVRRGLDNDETALALLRAVDDVQKASLPILEAGAAALQGCEEVDVDDWGFLVSL